MTTPIAHERTYATKGGLYKAIKTFGFDALNYEERQNADGKWAATFYVHISEDVHYLNSKGFTAEVDTSRAA